MEKEIYPLIIVKSRYSGSYEGGKWVAFNAEFDEVKDYNGDDITCASFYDMIDNVNIDVKNWFGEKILCGRGSTPQEAHDDLLKRIDKYLEVRKEKTFFAGNKINEGDLVALKEDGKIYSIKNENTSHSNTKRKKSKNKTS